MEFVKYPSLINSYQNSIVEYCVNFGYSTDSVWYVTEKIHGANFAFYVNPETEEIRCARRTSFLSKLENFYNFAYVQGKYQEGVLALAKHLGKPIKVYGELCGGFYDGKTQGMKVQREVQYCPHNEFIVFDIVVGNEVVSPTEVQMLCWEHGLIPAPLIFEGTLEEALKIDNAFNSLVGPRYFNLPEIADNICEGVVIKPWPLVRDIRGNLINFKNKNSKFSEKSHTKSPRIPKEITPELQELYGKLEPYITVNKLNAVISKVGNEPKFFAQVRGYFIQDIIEDSGISETYHALVGEQRKIILGELDKLILPMVRKALGVGP